MKFNLPLIALSVSMIAGALFLDMFVLRSMREPFVPAEAAAGTAPAGTVADSGSSFSLPSWAPTAIFVIGCILVAVFMSMRM
jgi:hypothetical protein